MIPLAISCIGGGSVELFGRPMQGSQEVQGTLYEIVDDEGEATPRVFDDEKMSRPILAFYDCIEVVCETAYAFDSLNKTRVGELGQLTENSQL